MDRKILGKRIRDERLRLNMTQEQLSEKINVTASYLGAVERGEKSMTLEKLIDLINVFDVSMDYMLSDFISVKKEDTDNYIWDLLNNMNTKQRRLTTEIAKLIKQSNL